MNFLIDYNLTGNAVLFWGTLAAEGWIDLLSIRFFTFKQAGLPTDSSDRIVWQFAQSNQMILITANRNMKGYDSLEQMIREENIATSLPIITIGNPDRFDERGYRVLQLKKYPKISCGAGILPANNTRTG
ncbi:DUF5615 family PIN-like protein, partial [Anabaena sp. PCC 7938]|uniref:DUF5615 family PIN-like protein n=2 Tax=Nostocaceae TaxID=1162 RepID=UPI00202F0510